MTDSHMSCHEPNGFSYRVRKSGDVEVTHFGVPAAVLRAADAAKFLASARRASDLELQHLMARATGHYKRGNERSAATHQRNR